MPPTAPARSGDLSQQARELRRVHDAVMGGSRPPVMPRAVVSRSWARVLQLGLDPSRPNARDLVPRAEVERRRHDSRLAAVVDEVRAVLGPVADVSAFIAVITDADGIVLWREGRAGVLRQADGLGFAEGARWSEDAVGTNAIGTALAERAPVSLFSAEHFETGQHPWYCAAAPVHDPVTGVLLGIVDVSGPALTLHPATVALVSAAVQLAQRRLSADHAESLERLRDSASHVLALTHGPHLLVDDDGWVAHQSGVRVRDRVGVPRADIPLAVPGLGLCLPERVGRGWLVRPRATEVTVMARLRTVDGEPVLEVWDPASGHDGWRTSLTPRHAAILRLLTEAGDDGLTAAALSRAMFGDDHHQVTVRAEVSRLRRVVGGLVAAAPYRIAAGARVACES